MKNVNTQVTGATQISGKSTSMLAFDAYERIVEDDCFIGCTDPDGTLGFAIAGHALEERGPEKVMLIDLNKSVFASWGLAWRSRNPDPIERARENRHFARMMAEAFSLGRGESIDQTRLIKEWAFKATKFWQNQKQDLPPEMLRSALTPSSRDFDLMVREYTEDDLHVYLPLKQYSPARLYEVIGPTARLFDEFFEETVAVAMLATTFDLESWMRDGGVIVLVGGDDEFVNRVIFKNFHQRCTQIVTANWNRYHEPLYTRHYIDEANSLITKAEAVPMNRTLKKGQSWCVLGQTANYGDPELNDLVAEGCTEKVLFHASSEEAAHTGMHHLKLLRDPGRVKRTLQRRRTMTTYDEITTVSVGESVGPDGKTRKDKRTGKTFRPTQQTVTDDEEELMPIHEQDALHEVRLMSLGLGECIVRNGPSLIGPFYIEKIEPPFSIPGLAKEYLDELLQQQIEQGIFRKPQRSTFQWKQTPAAGSATHTAKVMKNGRSSARSGMKGMS